MVLHALLRDRIRGAPELVSATLDAAVAAASTTTLAINMSFEDQMAG